MNGVDALFRIDAGVSCPSVYLVFYLILAGRLYHDTARVSTCVQDIAGFCLKPTEIEGLGPFQALFLPYGKKDFQIGMSQAVFPHYIKSLNYGRNGGFIVCSQYGVTLAANDAIFNYRPDAFSRLNCVHVGS